MAEVEKWLISRCKERGEVYVISESCEQLTQNSLPICLFQSEAMATTRLAYQCLKCYHREGLTYIDAKYRVEDHILKKHVPLDEVPYYCTLCLFRCFKWEQLLRHDRTFLRHRQMLALKGVHNCKEMFHASSRPFVVTEKDMAVLSREQSDAFWKQRKTVTHVDPVEQAMLSAGLLGDTPGPLMSPPQVTRVEAPMSPPASSLLGISGQPLEIPATVPQGSPALPVPARFCTPTYVVSRRHVPPSSTTGHPQPTGAQLTATTQSPASMWLSAAPESTSVSKSPATDLPTVAVSSSSTTVQIAAATTRPAPSFQLSGAAEPLTPASLPAHLQMSDASKPSPVTPVQASATAAFQSPSFTYLPDGVVRPATKQSLGAAEPPKLLSPSFDCLATTVALPTTASTTPGNTLRPEYSQPAFATRPPVVSISPGLQPSARTQPSVIVESPAVISVSTSLQQPASSKQPANSLPAESVQSPFHQLQQLLTSAIQSAAGNILAAGSIQATLSPEAATVETPQPKEVAQSSTTQEVESPNQTEKGAVENILDELLPPPELDYVDSRASSPSPSTASSSSSSSVESSSSLQNKETLEKIWQGIDGNRQMLEAQSLILKQFCTCVLDMSHALRCTVKERKDAKTQTESRSEEPASVKRRREEREQPRRTDDVRRVQHRQEEWTGHREPRQSRWRRR